MRYPHALLPGTGILIGLDDANLTCIITIANTNDLATTSMLALRTAETCITPPNVRGVRRGRERNLHGQVLEVQESELGADCGDVLPCTCAIHEPATPCKFSACM